MRDFRDKSRTPRFNRNAPRPPRRNSPASPAIPAAAPPSRASINALIQMSAILIARRGNDREIVYGVEPIRELVAAAPASIRVLYVKSGDERRFAAEIDFVRTGGGRVEFADEAGLERLAGPAARHQGIAALMREYEYVTLEQILADQPDPIVLVDGVTDPRNLGALLRSAEGAGVGAIVIAKDRTAGITPAAVKSSAGAWIHLKIARCGNVARTIEQLKEAGYWTAALAPGGDDFDLHARHIAQACDHRRLRGPRRPRHRKKRRGLRRRHPDARQSGLAQRVSRRRGSTVRNRPPPLSREIARDQVVP